MQSKECRERILSEEIEDFIMNDGWIHRKLEGDGKDCKIQLDYSFQILYQEHQKSLDEYPYYTIPGCYGLLDIEALEESGIFSIQNIPGMDLQGEGILMGFIDTGIRYQDPIFRNLDGTTRIYGIWDQTIQDGNAPEGLYYGSEYKEEEINEALKQEDPLSVIRSQDTKGHGTFLASLACGGGSETEQFVGAAPAAKIAVVKLKETKKYLKEYYAIQEETPSYQENDILNAIYYLDRLAKEKDLPLVLCIGLGNNLGDHNGSAPLSVYLELMCQQKGRVVAAASGNEADKRHHYLGVLKEQRMDEVELSVDSNNQGFTVEIWTEIPNLFRASVISPSGEVGPLLPIREQAQTYYFIFEQTRIYLKYYLLVDRTSSQLIRIRFEHPTVGIWKIRLEKVEDGDGRVHMWLPMEQMLTGPVFFLRSNPDYTIVNPADARSVNTISSYNGRDLSIAVDSGRGYTRTDGIKPDYAAPGIELLGMNQRGDYTRRSGSSIATAVAAGAIALLMEWLMKNGITPDSVQVKNLLILGCEKKEHLIYPNKEWGYGQMNLYQTFEVLRRI